MVSRILVTGSTGQIGSELTLELRRRRGGDVVVAAGNRTRPGPELRDSGPFEFFNVSDPSAVDRVVKKYEIDTVYHLAAVLSAVGEKDPAMAWRVNMDGLLNILEVARARGSMRVFFPSSIGVFGPESPAERTPQETVMLPETVYGISKVAGELLCDYYHRKFGVDVRGVRYPGIISSKTLPGGGTTDYAVAIFYAAIKENRYTCFVRGDTVLPMMYMPDCLKAAFQIMEADPAGIKRRCSYNVQAMSFSAEELAAEIQKHLPGFTCAYEPDARQAIADSWPKSLDDSPAREDWGWKPEFGLDAMTRDMLEKVRVKPATG